MAADLGLWAIWYDLAAQGQEEYLHWLHEEHLPQMLSRHGYLWAAHVRNVVTPEREAAIDRRLVHTNDPSVATGIGYLLLYGAEHAGIFASPSPDDLHASLPAQARAMLARRQNVRSSVFVEVERVEGPDSDTRRPGITPGPIIQFGTFSANAPENDLEISTWYTRSRLPLVRPLPGTVGTRKLVSIAGWARHAVFYEFASFDAGERNLIDTSEWTHKVIGNLVHAPHSPSLGERIWPPLQQALNAAS